MPEIALITGGGRSGKSEEALVRARRFARRAFVATAEAFDDEMSDRITAHRRQRGDDFQTIEAPLELAAAIAALHGVDVAVVDCLTVWLGNLMHHYSAEARIQGAIDDFLESLADPPCELIVVTNEVGMGIIPEHALSRRYRDLAGILNRRVAQRAQRVILMVAGIPVIIKGGYSDGQV